MLDINLIREKPDFVKHGIGKVQSDPALVDQALELDRRWRAALTESETAKAERKRESGKMAQLKDAAERQALAARMRGFGETIKELDAQADALRADLDALMLTIPNLPEAHVPVGVDASENVILRTEGEQRRFDFEPKPHWELGVALGIIDFERGVKLSGARFYVLLREGAHLHRALIAWMLDLHVKKHGYTEVYPPYLVNSKCLIGTGNLPKFADNLYHDAEEDLWLIPTAEVPLTNLHREEIIPAENLPLRYVGYTACFRREKVSAGTDVRGIKRVHQFDKVEMMKYCRPEESENELQTLLSDAEDVCKGLGLTYRIVEMCTGDLSFVACRKFDIEVWAGGCKEWLEVSSCSNMGDFQARRAGIRYRAAAGAKPDYVHTLNGSGLALPRTLIAVLENYQQADGSVAIPDVLKPYMGGLERIERA